MSAASSPRVRSRAASRLVTLVAAGAMVAANAACGGSGGDPPDATSALSAPQPALSSGSPTAVASPSGSPTPASATSPDRFVFPVAGHVSYAHVHHDYPATDIMAKCGSTVRAVTNGTILAVTRTDKWTPRVNDGATRGGLSISLKGDDGVRFYGSHLKSIDAAVRPGARVIAGQTIGKVGQTGDASACHLHFGISPVCQGVGDWWTQRGAIWPWKYLDSWRKGGSKSPVAAVDSWKAAHGCPKKPTVDP